MSGPRWWWSLEHHDMWQWSRAAKRAARERDALKDLLIANGFKYEVREGTIWYSDAEEPMPSLIYVHGEREGSAMHTARLEAAAAGRLEGARDVAKGLGLGKQYEVDPALLLKDLWVVSVRREETIEHAKAHRRLRKARARSVR